MKRVWIQALLVNYLAVVQTRNAPADQEQPTAVHLSPSPRLRRLNQHHHKSHRITTRAAGRPRGLARVGEWPFFPASPLRCRAQQTTESTAVNSSTAPHRTPQFSKQTIASIRMHMSCHEWLLCAFSAAERQHACEARQLSRRVSVLSRRCL